MTEFLPRASAPAVDASGRFTRETYDALRRTIAALNDADIALSERQRETLAILNALGADDVESLEALGPLLDGKQDASEVLDAVAAIIGTGIVAYKPGAVIGRTIAPVAGETTVANGSGLAGNPTVGLADVANSGAGSLLAITRDTKGRVSGTKAATITGTAGRVTVANGDASAGLPTVDLATVADGGGGTLLRIVRDAWGRITGTSAATTTDLAEGTNLYHTTARARAAAVADSITDAVTDVAPSQNAVFDALAGKASKTLGEEITGAWTFTAPVIYGVATQNQALQIHPASTGRPTYGGSVVITEYNATLNATQGIEFQGRGDGGGYGIRISCLSNDNHLIIEDRANSATWSERARIINGIGLGVTGSIKPGSYTVATVPSAATAGAGAMIYVSDEVGGAVPAFSDGTNWRRVTDRAIVS